MKSKLKQRTESRGIKARYPHLKVIATTVGLQGDPDVSDGHYYAGENSPPGRFRTGRAGLRYALAVGRAVQGVHGRQGTGAGDE